MKVNEQISVATEHIELMSIHIELIEKLLRCWINNQRRIIQWIFQSMFRHKRGQNAWCALLSNGLIKCLWWSKNRAIRTKWNRFNGSKNRNLIKSSSEILFADSWCKFKEILNKISISSGAFHASRILMNWQSGFCWNPAWCS